MSGDYSRVDRSLGRGMCRHLETNGPSYYNPRAAHAHARQRGRGHDVGTVTIQLRTRGSSTGSTSLAQFYIDDGGGTRARTSRKNWATTPTAAAVASRGVARRPDAAVQWGGRGTLPPQSPRGGVGDYGGGAGGAEVISHVVGNVFTRSATGRVRVWRGRESVQSSTSGAAAAPGGRHPEA